jgi:nicotinamidase-related amidase
MFPKFYDPDRPVFRLVDRDAVYKASKEWKVTENKHKACLFIINQQIGLCNPDSTSYLDGADGASRSLTEFIYENIGNIKQIVVVNHCAPILNLNNRLFWQTKTGKDLIIGEVVNLENYHKGKILISDKVYKNIPESGHEALTKFVEQSLRNIEEKGDELTVKCFSGIQGSLESALMPDVEEAIFFHSCVTGNLPCYETVGTHPFLNYESIFTPVMHGEVNKIFAVRKHATLDKLENHDRILFAGHPKEIVISSVEDMVNYRKDFGTKTIILQDCCRLSEAVGSLSEVGVEFANKI